MILQLDWGGLSGCKNTHIEILGSRLNAHFQIKMLGKSTEWRKKINAFYYWPPNGKITRYENENKINTSLKIDPNKCILFAYKELLGLSFSDTLQLRIQTLYCNTLCGAKKTWDAWVFLVKNLKHL